jgi:hypothetical protein
MATMNQNYIPAWINGGLVEKALGKQDRADEAFAKSKMLGYNGTATDYQMRAEPVLIEASANKSGGFEGALAVVGLFVLGCAMRRRNAKD